MDQFVFYFPGYIRKFIKNIKILTFFFLLKKKFFEVGSQTAACYRCKFIETSSGLAHHVDELLVGIAAQIELNPHRGRDQKSRRKRSHSSRKMIKKLLSFKRKSKSCENLFVIWELRPWKIILQTLCRFLRTLVPNIFRIIAMYTMYYITFVVLELYTIERRLISIQEDKILCLRGIFCFLTDFYGKIII